MGYVTEDAVLDRMIEARDAREWEEENDSSVWDKKLEAVGRINAAEEHFDNGLKILAMAVDEVEGTTAEDRVKSILDEFEELLCDLRILKKNFIEGR